MRQATPAVVYATPPPVAGPAPLAGIDEGAQLGYREVDLADGDGEMSLPLPLSP
jgi:hypothetical protein